MGDKFNRNLSEFGYNGYNSIYKEVVLTKVGVFLVSLNYRFCYVVWAFE